MAITQQEAFKTLTTDQLNDYSDRKAIHPIEVYRHVIDELVGRVNDQDRMIETYRTERDKSRDEVAQSIICPKPQVVAVVYRDMADNSIHKLKKRPSKPYFLLDMHGLKEGDFGLTHNGTAFAVVEVIRVLPIDDVAAMTRASKPILAAVDYDEDLLEQIVTQQKRFREETEVDRLQFEIDKELGRTPAQIREQLALTRSIADANLNYRGRSLQEYNPNISD